jgi:hypothetical protein
LSRAKPKPKRAGSLVEWAKATPRFTGGVSCTVCRHPDAVADIAALLEYRRAGNATPALTQVHRELAERYPKARITLHSLLGHVANHAGGWGGRG